MEIDSDSASNQKDSDKDSSSQFSDDDSAEPPSFSLATLGLQRVGTAPPPKPQPLQPIQTLNARGMPARIRKRNRLFFDDHIINDDKPLRVSLSPRKNPLKIASPIKTSSVKIKRKRKNIASRYVRSEEKFQKQKRKERAELEVSSRDESSRHTVSSKSSQQRSTPSVDGSVNSVENAKPTDRRIGERIGMRLRNLLKLPKAHRWVIFEWFYSFIDKPLLGERNDFESFVTNAFPDLLTRQLTRAEWRYIRSRMGRPRRCSAAFFLEERQELERKRQKMRYIQTQRIGDIKNTSFFRDLPEKIPLPLPVGTKVTARLREPQDGIFSGTVDAFDSLTSTYRVTFDRAGLGTHSVPDIEIFSENFHETLSLQSITKDFRPFWFDNINNTISGPEAYYANSYRANSNRNDPLLAQEMYSNSPHRNALDANTYPPSLLETIVRLKRALLVKRIKLQRLHNMNNDAELKASQQLLLTKGYSNISQSTQTTNHIYEPLLNLSEDFQRRYASIIISMEKMNRDIQSYLSEVQMFANELTCDPQMQAMLTPTYLREKCREMADDAVTRNNRGLVKNINIISLIKNLATILLVASHMNSDNSVQVTKVFEGCVEEVRNSIQSVNMETFQKNVQIHLHHIQLGIGKSFTASNTQVASTNGTNNPC